MDQGKMWAIASIQTSELLRVLVPLLPFVERNKSTCLVSNEKVADNLSKAGWSWSCVSTVGGLLIICQGWGSPPNLYPNHRGSNTVAAVFSLLNPRG